MPNESNSRVVGLLRSLDQEANSEARGFFLSGWNGSDGYTFDRIIRGCKRLDALCKAAERTQC